jgi:Fe-S oxidoreductase
MSKIPWLWNLIFGTPNLRRAANRAVGFHPERTIPLLPGHTLRQWWSNRPAPTGKAPNGTVHVFADEFSDYNDVHVGKAVIETLETLGYRVKLPKHTQSGRAALSKGLLRKARHYARLNVDHLKNVVTENEPLVGIEPSALLTFRDEYPDLLRGKEQTEARNLAANCFLFEEFIAREIDAGRVTPQAFTDEPRTIKLHGHCQQKAISSLTPAVRALELPANYQVQIIPSGCCGMAGSFGYEAEHYELSMKIGELVLFPAVRNAPAETLIAAPGTSCRHQIHDGTDKKALHPAEILRAALKS